MLLAIFFNMNENTFLKAAMTECSLLATSKQAGLAEYLDAITSSLKAPKLAVSICTEVPL